VHATTLAWPTAVRAANRQYNLEVTYISHEKRVIIVDALKFLLMSGEYYRQQAA
jgi:hypothetical protein